MGLFGSEIFDRLKMLLRSAKNNEYDKMEFGSFKLGIKGTKDLNYFFSRLNSIQLFDRMIVELIKYNKNEELILQLENLKKRITF